MTSPATSAVTYRLTALGTALIRMWRAWLIIVPVVVINAIAQALLVLGDPVGGLSLGPILLAVVSFLILVAALALVGAASLQVATGAVDTRRVIATSRQQYLKLVLWSLGLLVVVALGLSLYVIPGLLVLALAPYLLLAVIDGAGNPLAADFRAIAARWGRWLVTVIVTGVIAWVLWLLAAVNTFFVTGAPAAFIAWICCGLVASWFLVAWALIWRAINGPVAHVE